MRALVVYCHPNPGSFSAAMRDAAVRGLHTAGHDVEVIDLYGEHFDPVMSSVEWAEYRLLTGEVPPELQHHVDLVKSAEIFVFVYPTWWSGLPAMLKGWVERVMLPGVAFTLSENGRLRPGLRQARKIYVISTYGSPRLYVKAVNDNGRRIMSRTLRFTMGFNTSVVSLKLYKMDKRTQTNREKFLKRIERSLARA